MRESVRCRTQVRHPWRATEQTAIEDPRILAHSLTPAHASRAQRPEAHAPACRCYVRWHTDVRRKGKHNGRDRRCGIRLSVVAPTPPRPAMLEPGSDSVIAELTGKADGIAEVRRQEALLKTGALQNAILTSANFSIIATDEKGIIQLFNVGAERMLGYVAADVVNRISPSDMHDPQEVMARAEALSLELGTTIAPGFEALCFKASRGIEDIYELTYIRKDGSRFPAIVSITALRDDYGDIIGYLLIGTDNSVRKQVELELHNAMAVAEQANLAKSDFLSSMSHELRTPLSAILGFAQLMESGSPPPTVSQKRSIDQILQAGWYLLELINEILDLALIESGKLSLSLEPSSLAEVMHECRAMIEPQAHKRGISVTFPQFEVPYLRQSRPHARQAGADQPAFQCDEIQPARWVGGGRLQHERPGTHSHLRHRHRRRIDAGAGAAAVPAVQSSRPGSERRGRHRHRPGRMQAAHRNDGRRRSASRARSGRAACSGSS